MTRQDLKEIIVRVIEQVGEDEVTPVAGCIYQDTPPEPCDATTWYGIGEEG